MLNAILMATRFSSLVSNSQKQEQDVLEKASLRRMLSSPIRLFAIGPGATRLSIHQAQLRSRTHTLCDLHRGANTPAGVDIELVPRIASEQQL